jgi:hypothetical protein
VIFATGQTPTDTLAHVLERDPDWATLPEQIPASIVTLLRRCLRKGLAESALIPLASNPDAPAPITIVLNWPAPLAK